MSSTAAPPAPTTVCASCGSDEPWGFASWCPRCGYYPKLKMTVTTPEIPGETPEAPANLVESIPSWGWALGAGVVAIIGLSLWARFSIDPDNSLRFQWSVIQIALGAVALAVVQGETYLFAAGLSDRWGPFDVFMKPLSIWQPTIAELPNRSSRICAASWALVAVLAGLFIVDGIPFGSMFGDQPAKKKKFNLVHSITGMAKSDAPADGDLEEAMNDFAGKADQTGGAGKGEDGNAEGGEATEDEEEEKKEEKKETKPDAAADAGKKAELAECVVFGYLPDGDDDIAMLLLASMVKPEPKAKERLKFVTSITAESLPISVRRELARRLKSLKTTTPAVKIAVAAVWVQLDVRCKVRHQGLTRDKRFKQAEFVELLEGPHAVAPAKTQDRKGARPAG